MKNLLIAVAFVAVFTFGSANATNVEYNFSYHFGNGSTITGSFLANANANGIFSNISHIQASLDGNQFLDDATSHSLIAVGWNTTTGSWDSLLTPVISVHADLNNFIFADTNAANNPDTTNYFEFVNDPINGQVVGASDNNVLDSNNNPLSAFDSPASSWSVSAVPEPNELLLMVLGLPMLMLRLRNSKAV